MLFLGSTETITIPIFSFSIPVLEAAVTFDTHELIETKTQKQKYLRLHGDNEITLAKLLSYVRMYLVNSLSKLSLVQQLDMYIGILMYGGIQ